ncbi:MAG: DNA primase DnaG [Candidatus Methanomethylicia archaeon]
MGGAPVTIKYLIRAGIEISGIVDKPDVIGAIFGQTEGLLGEDLDLRELQKSGRIGRIHVELIEKGDKSHGEIVIPSGLDRAETALIAASLEVIEKVGPCDARVHIKAIEDIREEKRRKILERAKELLKKMSREAIPNSRKLADEVLNAVREQEVIKYGSEELPAGPEIDTSDTVIVVEGRADVINLIKNGFKNVIGMGGTSIPKTIIDLSRRKHIIAFVDGDRGGELILRELLKVAEIDEVAIAPPGKEVEELTNKEIVKCLQNRVPVAEYLHKDSIQLAKQQKALIEGEISIPQSIMTQIKELENTLEAILYDNNWNIIQKVAVSELPEIMQKIPEAYALAFDGIITQRILDLSEDKSVKLIIGAKLGNIVKKPLNIQILTFTDLKKEENNK